MLYLYLLCYLYVFTFYQDLKFMMKPIYNGSDVVYILYRNIFAFKIFDNNNRAGGLRNINWTLARHLHLYRIWTHSALALKFFKILDFIVELNGILCYVPECGKENNKFSRMGFELTTSALIVAVLLCHNVMPTDTLKLYNLYSYLLCNKQTSSIGTIIINITKY